MSYYVFRVLGVSHLFMGFCVFFAQYIQDGLLSCFSWVRFLCRSIVGPTGFKIAACPWVASGGLGVVGQFDPGVFSCYKMGA